MVVGHPPAAAPETELSWFDGSVVTDLAADGSQMLFIETAEAENPYYACYLRSFDGSPAVRLGTGNVSRFSADGQWVVSVVPHPRHALVLYPTGLGEARTVPMAGIERVWWAGFHADGEHLFVAGSAAGRPRRLYLLPIAGGSPRLLCDADVHFDRFVGLPISPDGERVVLRWGSGEYVSLGVRTGAVEPVAGPAPDDAPLRFDQAGRSLYVTGGAVGERTIERLDLASGVRSGL